MSSRTLGFSQNISVACRIRPLVQSETSSSSSTCITSTNDSIEICGDDDASHSFGFDAVFGPDCEQEDIFNKVCDTVLRGVVAGFNGTIFCYGQTASGKTWTMEGSREGSGRGITPRCFELLFDSLLAAPEHMEFTVRASMIEIYLERISDLLDSNGRNGNLPIKEHPTRGPCVHGANEISVSSVEELQNLLRFGAQNRAVGFTKMNSRSSRSHSLFSVTVTVTDKRTDTSTNATLNLVDLAGSEKIKQTEASGQTLEEAKKINLSLSALGNVINALSNGKSKKNHVPYRDSKLTRILQESLGGNSNTTLIVTVSPSVLNCAESVSTLRFGQRAKAVKNCAMANKQLSSKELKNLLLDRDSEISRLKQLLESRSEMSIVQPPVPAKCGSTGSIETVSTEPPRSSMSMQSLADSETRSSQSSRASSHSELPGGGGLLELSMLLREFRVVLDRELPEEVGERFRECAARVRETLDPICDELPLFGNDAEAARIDEMLITQMQRCDSECRSMLDQSGTDLDISPCHLEDSTMAEEGEDEEDTTHPDSEEEAGEPKTFEREEFQEDPFHEGVVVEEPRLHEKSHGDTKTITTFVPNPRVDSVDGADVDFECDDVAQQRSIDLFQNIYSRGGVVTRVRRPPPPAQKRFAKPFSGQNLAEQGLARRSWQSIVELFQH